MPDYLSTSLVTRITLSYKTIDNPHPFILSNFNVHDYTYIVSMNVHMSCTCIRSDNGHETNRHT